MSSSTFSGLLGPLPDAMSRGFAVFRPVSEVPAPVRFAEGFEPFERYLLDQGARPDELAGDLSALWEFLASQPQVLESNALAAAAAIFAGNAIAVVHPAATWRVTTEPEIGTETRSLPVVGLVRMMVEHPERRESFIEMLSSWDHDDRDEQERKELTRQQTGPSLVLPPEQFERPPFPQRTYLDENGQAIEYGFRWAHHDAPSDAYSRVSNPDRFAPLLLDVEALVDYLHTWYLVDVERSIEEDGTLRVHLQPAAGAAVAITATSESVQVAAGALFRLVVPDCSCDACDETAESEAVRLEEALFAIAAGGLQERYPLGHRRWLYTRLRHIDGGGSSSSGDPTAISPAHSSLTHETHCTPSPTGGGRPGSSDPTGLPRRRGRRSAAVVSRSHDGESSIARLRRTKPDPSRVDPC